MSPIADTSEGVPLHHVWTYTAVDRTFWNEHLEAWVPRRIIDAHVHVYHRAHQLVPMTQQMRQQYWVNELIEPIDADQTAHCDNLTFPGRQVAKVAFGWPSLEYDLVAANRYLQQECPRRGWYCLALLKPQWSAERVTQELDQPGVIGLKPYYSLISFNPDTRDEHQEKSIFDFLPHHALQVADQRRAWITLHVPRADRLGHPDNIREVKLIREKYPNVKLVIAHLGRNYTLPHARESLVHFKDDPGLYFDNSAVLNPDVLRYTLELLGPSRILYGTDNPVFYMRGRRQWRGRQYFNRTSHPFHFNREREPAEIEARYTLYMYEALLALRRACEDLQLSAHDLQRIFCDNAVSLIRDAPP
ncbi:MAG: amidohydrolase family protein [Phycisphaeraceae bacterium]|nr:amidohydrolase family protein [Phycisphaeraceae bacterium]